jgi:hypothetical protein
MDIGKNSYIDGAHLPQRMVDTIEMLLPQSWEVLMLIEYDTLILKPVQVENMTELLAGHYAGGRTWESKASAYYHNPWLFKRDIAALFVLEGKDAISSGVCGQKTGYALAEPEGSPDVFFGYIAEQIGTPVQSDLWSEYTRNDLKDPAHLEEARRAYQDGVDVIHGCKSQHELDYITKP